MNINPFKKKNKINIKMNTETNPSTVDENLSEDYIENIESNTNEEGSKKSENTESELFDVHPYVRELEQNISEWKDRHLRLQAEFDNYKKRTVKEKRELEQITKEDFVKAFLPIIDQIDLALTAGKISENLESLKEGLAVLHKNLDTTLEKLGIQAMESKGAPFNSELHEAIVSMPAPDPEMKGIVLDEIKKGYLLNQKVIRYAQVVVGE